MANDGNPKSHGLSSKGIEQRKSFASAQERRLILKNAEKEKVILKSILGKYKELEKINKRYSRVDSLEYDLKSLNDYTTSDMVKNILKEREWEGARSNRLTENMRRDMSNYRHMEKNRGRKPSLAYAREIANYIIRNEKNRIVIKMKNMIVDLTYPEVKGKNVKLNFDKELGYRKNYESYYSPKYHKSFKLPTNIIIRLLSDLEMYFKHINGVKGEALQKGNTSFMSVIGKQIHYDKFDPYNSKKPITDKQYESVYDPIDMKGKYGLKSIKLNKNNTINMVFVDKENAKKYKQSYGHTKSEITQRRNRLRR